MRKEPRAPEPSPHRHQELRLAVSGDAGDPDDLARADRKADIAQSQGG
jgi:hypothetical protein